MSVLDKIVKIERIIDKLSKKEFYHLHGEGKKRYRINLLENQKEKVVFEVDIEKIENFFLEIHKKTKRITIIDEDGEKIEIMSVKREEIIIEYYIFMYGVLKRIVEEWDLEKTHEFVLKRSVNKNAGVSVGMEKNDVKENEVKYYSLSRIDGEEFVRKNGKTIVGYKNVNELKLIIQYLLAEDEI